VTTVFDLIKTGVRTWRDDVDTAAANLPVIGSLFARKWRILRMDSASVRYTSADGESIDIPAQHDAATAREQIRKIGKKGPLVLRFASHFGFRREASFPVAARKHLDEAIELALPRLSPLPAEDIVFAADRSRLQENDGRISLPVSIIRRETLDSALERAREWGLETSAVDLENGQPDTPPTVDLQDGRHAPSGGRSAFALGAIISGILLIGLIAFALDRNYRLEPEFADARRPASLEARLEAAITHAEAKSRSGSSIAALADLSRRLPDSAYLTSFAYDAGEIRITGLAWDAAAALRALDAAEEFASAAFIGATVRDEETGRERFELTARHSLQVRESGS
jgi:general secretion pathway protein L